MNSLFDDRGVRSVAGGRDGVDPDGGEESMIGEGMDASRARPDVEARNRLVQANLGLVHRVARPFANRGLTLEDLVGEGTLGLIRAAQRYDPAMGTRFSTYATYWIRDAIQTALAKMAGPIRLPMNVCRLMARWVRTEMLLRQVRGHAPTFEETAAAMGLDRSTQALIARAHRVKRLQMAADDSEDVPSAVLLMHDQGQTAEETLSAREEKETISRRLERLDTMERAAVSLRYGLSGEPAMSFGQIGARLGLTSASVRKIVGRAMRELGGRQESRSSDRRRPIGTRVG